MDCLASIHFSWHGFWDALNFVANLGSVVFGILGTWLMSRRYARRFGLTLLFAIFFPILFLIGQGNHFRNSVKATINTNRDVEDSVTDMAIGLYLLFWAFFLQLIALGIETFK